jgi:hypothetical protein
VRKKGERGERGRGSALSAELGIIKLKINVFKAYSVGFFQKFTLLKRIALNFSERRIDAEGMSQLLCQGILCFHRIRKHAPPPLSSS